MQVGSIAFGFIAGMLSTLSPCVLPLLPLVIGPAISSHRFGLPALAAGLVVSFVGIGLFVAWSDSRSAWMAMSFVSPRRSFWPVSVSFC